jgi:hypothetical protein
MIDIGHETMLTQTSSFFSNPLQYAHEVTVIDVHWLPHAVVPRLHVTTLALIHEGRLRWRDALPGSVVVEGDEDLAAGLLDGLPPSSGWGR